MPKRQRVSMGSTGQALVITDLDFDADGFVTNQKSGLLPFDPEKDLSEMLDKAGKVEWEVYGLKNVQGFYSVRKRRDLNEEEMKKQIVTLSGRSIINYLDEVATPEVTGRIVSGHETNTSSRVNQEPLLVSTK